MHQPNQDEEEVVHNDLQLEGQSRVVVDHNWQPIPDEIRTLVGSGKSLALVEQHQPLEVEE